MDEFPLGKMAKVFNISRSGFYNIKKEQSPTKAKNAALLIKIKDAHEKSRHVYGSPRIHAVLKK